MAALDAGALRLLACAALAILAVGLLVLAAGASKSSETRAWALVLALALPGGLLLAARQERVLAAAAPAAAARGLAVGLLALALAFLVRRTGAGDALHHAVLALAALVALGAPFLAARLWVDPDDRERELARVVSVLSAVFVILLFVPRGALEPAALLPALALATLAVLALRLRRPLSLSRTARAALELLACVAIVLVVVQLPGLVPYSGNLWIHHLYFLGPANDVAHGQAMVGTAWSQYGVGLIDALGLAFKVVPIGFGTLALGVVILTALLYLCVYAILRLAGLGFLLTMIAIAVAALGNLFATLDAYVVFPSTSPLRFGIPYLMVLAAVLGATAPRLARPSRIAVLALLALAAVWSLETFAYAAGTFGALVLVEALAAGDGAGRRVLRAALVGLAVSAAAFAAFSLATLVLSGHLDWGPYVEYLTLYSVDGLSQVSIQFFSAGPLMAAVLFASAVMLLWLVRASPAALAPAMRTALAGFTGFAILAFTYYLGRSHPNNLLVLLVPVVAICALWMQVLLAGRSWWRTGAAGALALGMAMIAVAAWPAFEAKRGSTALGLLAPGGGTLGSAVGAMADNPVLDPRVPVGTALLAEQLPPGEPALVIAGSDLTTQILLDADRRNVLPISHAAEDDLIESSGERVEAAAERVPAGTVLLTSEPSPPVPGAQPEFFSIQLAALDVLQRRFRFVPVRVDPSGLELVRLVPRR